jgi:streptomycin 6-kinase
VAADWRPHLRRLADECAELWSLRLDEPFPYSYASLTFPAKLEDGSEAVLKISRLHRESEHEADALGRWNGEGAIRLLAHDRERSALLLERCRPGTPLSEVGAEAALEVIAGLLPKLWVAAAQPFRALAEEAAWWLSYLPERWERTGRPFERALLDVTTAALRELVPAQGEPVLLHQDLHADNILRAEREPWLVIDPKPLVGEREFGLAPVIRGGELGHSERDVRHRLGYLSTELGLDRERARGWALGQTLAWAWEADEVLPGHVETARWLARA